MTDISSWCNQGHHDQCGKCGCMCHCDAGCRWAAAYGHTHRMREYVCGWLWHRNKHTFTKGLE